MGASNSHELRRALEDFEIVRLLGKGAWGKVWLVRQGAGGKLFALKSLHRPSIIAEDLVEHTRLEREVLLTCQSPFVISLHAAFATTDSLYFVLDYVPGGSLWSYLCAHPDQHVGEAAARFYAAEMVLGIAELHRRGFVYRDVKPDNMLIQQDGRIILSLRPLVPRGNKVLTGLSPFLPPRSFGVDGFRSIPSPERVREDLVILRFSNLYR